MIAQNIHSARKRGDLWYAAEFAVALQDFVTSHPGADDVPHSPAGFLVLVL